MKTLKLTDDQRFALYRLIEELDKFTLDHEGDVFQLITTLFRDRSVTIFLQQNHLVELQKIKNKLYK